MSKNPLTECVVGLNKVCLRLLSPAFFVNWTLLALSLAH